MKMNWFDYLTMFLVVLGGINWGLIGFFQYNLFASLFGDMSMVTRVIYDLVGLSAVYMSFAYFSKK